MPSGASSLSPRNLRASTFSSDSSNFSSLDSADYPFFPQSVARKSRVKTHVKMGSRRRLLSRKRWQRRRVSAA